MKPYNGFNPAFRDLVWKAQQALRTECVIDWRVPCEMCGQTNVMPHLEDYCAPADFTAVCIACHMKLHSRFRDPVAWFRHLAMIGTGWRSPRFYNVHSYFKASRYVRTSLDQARAQFGERFLDGLGTWASRLPMEPVDWARPHVAELSPGEQMNYLLRQGRALARGREHDGRSHLPWSELGLVDDAIAQPGLPF